jgi:phosphate transport system permease protein
VNGQRGPAALASLSPMSVPTIAATPLGEAFPHRQRLRDRLGDRLLLGLTGLAALVAIAVILLMLLKIISGASEAISHFGLGFLVHSIWNPSLSQGVANSNVYGAGTLIYYTVVTSAVALLVSVPLGIAIGLYLSLLAHGRVGAIIGPLVELLAAIPSVVLGLWGIIVFAPVMHSTIEPALHAVLGFIPIFGEPSQTGLGVFTTGVVLAIMIVPIIASISRDLFNTVPSELKDGALALGATQWEMIRGVVLDSTRPGLAAATILGLMRGLGEAVATTMLIGFGSVINANLFATGDTLASRIIEQFIDAVSKLQTSSLYYCALILLAIELLANLGAQLIIGRYQRRRGLVR